MAEELTRALLSRAERGDPRGAAAVLTGAQRRLEAGGESAPWWRRGPVFAVAFAVTLFAVGGVLLATRLLVSETAPPATVPDATTVPATTATAPPPSVDVAAADRVFDVALASDGILWAAAEVGVVRWDLATEAPTVFSEADGLGSRRVHNVAVAADGTVWAAGEEWLARYDGAWAVLGEDILAALDGPIGDIAVGHDGTLWVAAGVDALIRIDTGSATTYQVPAAWLLANPWAMSISVDPAGTVWASTMQFGVLAFDGEWRRFDVGEGLPSDKVGNITTAADGTVWVGGDGLYGDPRGDIAAAGVARFDGSTWTSFTTEDGLLSNDGDVVVGPDGDVWAIHTSLPEEVADALDVHLLSGLSHYDGTRWRTYADVPTGYGRGAVVSADGTLWMPSQEGILGFDGTETTRLIVGPGGVPPPGEPRVLQSVEEAKSVRLATSIGEIEFTSWFLPGGDSAPWPMAQTPHGIITDLPPDRTPAWSRDGITWTEIPLSVAPYGWSGQAAAYGDDLYVFRDGGVARMAWDGAGWAEAGIIPAPPVDRGAIGPQGIVAVRLERVYYWDGAEFTEAGKPPDPSLHPDPSAGCLVPGWTGEGIVRNLGPVAATDNGFVALAARSQADWHKNPLCEPIVWRSDDGDVWTLLSDESPFGDRSFIHDIDVTGGRMVAVGGLSPEEAAVWVSDDGMQWERANLDAAQIWQVSGGARGWVVVGNHEPDGDIGEMWFSPDGLAWDGPYQRPPGWGDRYGMEIAVTMLDDRIVGAGIQFDSPGMAMDDAHSRVIVGEFVDE